MFYVGCSILAFDLVLYCIAIGTKALAKNVHLPEGRTKHKARDAVQRIISKQSNGEHQPLLQSQGDHRFTQELSGNRSTFIKAMPVLVSLKSAELPFALLLSLMQAMLIGTFEATIPMIASDVFHLNPRQTGLMLTPLTLLDLLSAPVFGLLVDKYGPKPVVLIAYGYLGSILALLSLPLAEHKAQFEPFISLVALSGIGIGAAGVPAAVVASNAIDTMRHGSSDKSSNDGYYGQMFGLLDFSYWIGLTIGPLLGGGLKQMVGFGHMTTILAVTCAIIAFICPVCIS